MNGAAICPLTAADIPALLPLMQAFCRDEKLAWDAGQRRALLEALLATPATGSVWLAAHPDRLAGYAIIGFCFSLEFGGRFALLDELYVLPPFQGQQLGTRLLQAAEACAREAGCHALRLEVSDDNPGARRLYERLGYQAAPRRILGRNL